MSKKNPALIIDLFKVRHNAQVISALCKQHGIQVAGVTKGFCAIPEVAEAMLEGGCTMLADSRVKNLQKLRESHFKVEHLLLRTPMLSEVDEVVQCADISLNSEIGTILALNAAAQRLGIQHKIILMIDVGDLREGIWPTQLPPTIEAILTCDHLLFEGIGCNLGCYGGVIPSLSNMQMLLDQKALIETHYHLPVKLVSGGNSSAIQLLNSGDMPRGVNHFRVGEAILLGRSTTDRYIVPGAYQDTIFIRAEVIECNWKPSVPIGRLGQDAFGHSRKFPDRGRRNRAILALGRQDISTTSGLVPFNPQIEILGATSDHVLLDVTAADQFYRAGDTLMFYPNYTAMLNAATSEYVEKEFI